MIVPAPEDAVCACCRVAIPPGVQVRPFFLSEPGAGSGERRYAHLACWAVPTSLMAAGCFEPDGPSGVPYDQPDP